MTIALTFVTSNNKKYKELQQLYPALEQLPYDLPEIQSLDIEEIVQEKVTSALHIHPGPLIVEDTSLAMEALEGLPGPFIKFFLESIGVEQMYEIAQMKEKYKAVATMVLGYGSKGCDPVVFRGDVSGRIVAPQGSGGFGYDSIFVPDGFTCTNAEMSETEKIASNPRAIAVTKLKKYLNTID